MLTGMRKHTRGWIAGGLLTLISAAFVVWGIPHDIFSGRPNSVAKGDNLEITAPEFSKAFDSAMTELRNRNAGRSITVQEAVANGIDMQVLERMVAERAFDRIASKMGLDASDAMVAEQIKNEPAFRSQLTNQFDKATYAQVLAQNRLSPAQFEADLRAGLRRQQLAKAVAGSGFASKAVTDFLFQFETEKRSIMVAAAPMTLAGKPPEPTDAEIKSYYEQNKPRLQTPEYRKVTLVIADPVAFQQKVVVDEEKVKALYEFQKGKIGGGEKRTFVQITAPDEQRASEAAKRLAAGEDAAKIGAALKLPVIPFQATPKDKVPDPALAEAVFAMKEGQTTGPIKGKLAWTAARVTKIEAGAAPSFDSVHAQLRAEIAREEADSALNDAVQKFEDERSGGKTLEQAALDAGLLIVPHDRVDAQGRDSSGAAIQTLSESPQLLQTLFATTASEATDFTPLQGGGYALARVDDIIAPGVRPLAEVKPMLVLNWKAQKINEIVAKIADGLVADVKAGKNFAASARARKMPIVLTEAAFTRRSLGQTPFAAMGPALFSAKPGEVVSAPDARGGAILVALLTIVQKTDPASDKNLYDQAQAAAANMIDQDTLQGLQNAALADAKVKYNEKLRKQAIGATDPAEDGAEKK